jgi:hypothetical protein
MTCNNGEINIPKINNKTKTVQNISHIIDVYSKNMRKIHSFNKLQITKIVNKQKKR